MLKRDLTNKKSSGMDIEEGVGEEGRGIRAMIRCNVPADIASGDACDRSVLC